jgi:hypothetical protein
MAYGRSPLGYVYERSFNLVTLSRYAILSTYMRPLSTSLRGECCKAINYAISSFRINIGWKALVFHTVYAWRILVPAEHSNLRTADSMKTKCIF